MDLLRQTYKGMLTSERAGSLNLSYSATARPGNEKRVIKAVRQPVDQGKKTSLPLGFAGLSVAATIGGPVPAGGPSDSLINREINRSVHILARHRNLDERKLNNFNSLTNSDASDGTGILSGA
jgi:hypothetical protein